MNRFFIRLGLVLGLVTATSHVLAEGTVAHERDSVLVDLHADLDTRSIYGFGGRIEIPLTRSVLPGADDDLTLSGGAEFLHPWDPFVVMPIAALQWNFFLGRVVSIFPEGGVVIRDRVVRRDQAVHHALWPEPYLGLGGRLHFTPSVAILARVNYPAGFQLGVTF